MTMVQDKPNTVWFPTKAKFPSDQSVPGSWLLGPQERLSRGDLVTTKQSCLGVEGTLSLPFRHQRTPGGWVSLRGDGHIPASLRGKQLCCTAHSTQVQVRGELGKAAAHCCPHLAASVGKGKVLSCSRGGRKGSVGVPAVA